MTKSEACRVLAEKLGWPCGEGFFDPTTSESASGRLLDAMPEPELWLESSKGESKKIWGCHADLSEPSPEKPDDKWSGAHHPDRKTAVFLAALRWQGINEEIEGL